MCLLKYVAPEGATIRNPHCLYATLVYSL
jgi:hypothetical protein